jgi:pimeloyl-ACP methyl ester carboxylesterase
LHGEHDEKFGELYQELPHAVIKNSGHICHMENPKAVAEKITHFMENIHAS